MPGRWGWLAIGFFRDCRWCSLSAFLHQIRLLDIYHLFVMLAAIDRNATAQCLANLGIGNRKLEPPISPSALSCAGADWLIALAARTAKQCRINGIRFGAAVAPAHRGTVPHGAGDPAIG